MRVASRQTRPGDDSAGAEPAALVGGRAGPWFRAPDPHRAAGNRRAGTVNDTPLDGAGRGGLLDGQASRCSRSSVRRRGCERGCERECQQRCAGEAGDSNERGDVAARARAHGASSTGGPGAGKSAPIIARRRATRKHPSSRPGRSVRRRGERRSRRSNASLGRRFPARCPTGRAAAAPRRGRARYFVSAGVGATSSISARSASSISCRKRRRSVYSGGSTRRGGIATVRSNTSRSPSTVAASA